VNPRRGERTDPVALQIGQRVSSHRRKARLSTDELADRAALPASEVSLLESGEKAARIPRVDVLVRLAEGLGIAPEALLKGINWNAGRPGGLSGGPR